MANIFTNPATIGNNGDIIVVDRKEQILDEQILFNADNNFSKIYSSNSVAPLTRLSFFLSYFTLKSMVMNYETGIEEEITYTTAVGKNFTLENLDKIHLRNPNNFFDNTNGIVIQYNCEKTGTYPELTNGILFTVDLTGNSDFYDFEFYVTNVCAVDSFHIYDGKENPDFDYNYLQKIKDPRIMYFDTVFQTNITGDDFALVDDENVSGTIFGYVYGNVMFRLFNSVYYSTENLVAYTNANDRLDYSIKLALSVEPLDGWELLETGAWGAYNLYGLYSNMQAKVGNTIFDPLFDVLDDGTPRFELVHSLDKFEKWED